MASLKIILEKPIVFFPQVAKVLGGINEALFWQQCYYWNDKTKRTDGFFYKTIAEFQEETFLTPYQQRKVRERLIELGVLEEKRIKANGAPTMHFRVNTSVIEKLISDSEETSLSNVKKLNIPLTENTTETTTNVVTGKPVEQVSEETEAPKDEVKKNFYLVVKKYSLPIMNHRHIDSWCEKLKQAHGETVANAYLVRLQERDLREERKTEQFVPTLNRAMDILDKSVKIIDYFTRTKKEHENANIVYEPLLENTPFPVNWDMSKPEMKTVYDEKNDREDIYFRGVMIGATNQVALMEYKKAKEEQSRGTK